VSIVESDAAAVIAQPPLAADLVARPRLVRRLAATPPGGVAVLVAPAGYGKTTLLRQWEESDPRPFTWIRADDVAGLLAPAPGTVVVIDDVHLVRSPVARAAVCTLAHGGAPGSLVAFASRAEPPLPLGRLRIETALVELRAADLAMTAPEATQLLRRAGLPLEPPEVAALARRTEGWPAGLALAAQSLHEQPDPHAAVPLFAGDDRLVADYLRDALLAELSIEQEHFLLLTSPLGELSGPLCDAVLDREGSGRVLRDLARSNCLLAPLDRTGERFRYHPLLADMLRSELRAAEPGRAVEVHRRASAWHEEQGDRETAIEHAIAAGDVDRAGELMWVAAGEQAGEADVTPLQRWVAGFRDGQIAARPALALSAATGCVLGGNRDAAERWTLAAERRIDASRPDLQAGAAVLRAMVARRGLEQMGDDARRAYDLADADSPWHALACLLAGIAHHLGGERERARGELEEGAREALGEPATRATCLAQLALLEMEDDDLEQAADHARRARHLAVQLGDAGGEASALVFAVAAFAGARAGAVGPAREDVREGRRRLAAIGDFAPWYEAEARIALARAELRLSDAAGARTLLAEASRAMHRIPEAAVLQRWIDEAWERADSFAVGAVSGPATLTTAELRVLRFLPSHMSFREVAARLHVSANTVKTQAHAVYRKLDASSRSEAVARAREVGLIDG
jgi:LuxR family maltose regulon positive regulatory protein